MLHGSIHLRAMNTALSTCRREYQAHKQRASSCAGAWTRGKSVYRKSVYRVSVRLCHYLPSSLMHPALLRHRRLRKHLANKPPLACRDTPWAKRQSKRGQITYAQCRPTCRGNIACQKAATKHALAETAAVLLDTRRQTDTPDSRNSGSIARIKRQTDTPWSQRQCCSPKGGRLTRL
jgi:hypothetical protein